MEDVREKLNDKQKKFVDYYCQSGNASRSAERAGYSKKTARSQGVRLLTNANVAAAIEQRSAELEDERIADITEIKQFWTATMRSDYVEHKDKLKASEMLAKTKGAFIEKVEHSGEMTNKQIDMSDLSIEELKALANNNGQ